MGKSGKPLVGAVWNGEITRVEELLEKGVTIEELRDGLYCAYWYQPGEIFEQVLQVI